MAIGRPDGPVVTYHAVNTCIQNAPTNTDDHWAVISTDCSAAYPSILRASVLTAFAATPELLHMLPLANAQLSVETLMQMFEEGIKDGLGQGKPTSTLYYVMGTDKQLRWAVAAMKNLSGLCVANADDTFFVGPLRATLKIVAKLKQRMLDECGLSWNTQKFEIYCTDMNYARATLASRDPRICVHCVQKYV